MKVTLRENGSGTLTAYVAKKDLEEEVVNQTLSEDSKVLTLANGWELAIDPEEPLKLPTTIEARRL